MTRSSKARSHGANRGFPRAAESRGALYTRPEATNSHGNRKGWRDVRLPRNWRDRLPAPQAYFDARLEKLGKPNGSGWAQARCPFHEDREASLSVNLEGTRGGWKCFAGCGSGDLVAFHMRTTGKDFRDAVLDLVRGGA